MLQCKQCVKLLVNSSNLRSFRTKSTRIAISSSTSSTETAVPVEDKNVFGTLSASGRGQLAILAAEKEIPDDLDGYDKLEFDITARKNAYYYKYEIAKFARQGAPGLRKALELFREMKSEARLEPAIDNFSTLIYGCAKAGYTKRAFDLYDEYLRFEQKPTNSMITCLINACAESPFPEYGLERLKWFISHVKINYNKQLNETHYNCAIKAFGKLGQLEEASKLVQEMLDNNVIPSIYTFHMLLIGCASNKEAGCIFALRIFKRMKMYQYTPTTITYRLLLRCIRDCGLGSEKLVKKTLKELPSVMSHDQRLKYKSEKGIKELRSKLLSEFEWVSLIDDLGHSIKTATSQPNTESDKSLKLEDDHSEKSSTAHANQLVKSTNLHTTFESQLFFESKDEIKKLPNLLSNDHLDLIRRIQIVQFDKLMRPDEKLILFGGVLGFLEAMMKDGCKPDSKTMSLLLNCLKPNRENYLNYHKLTKEFKITCDLLYYDLLIQDVCQRCVGKQNMELALEFVEQMHLDNLRPNISTFESLAEGCTKWGMAKKLLEDVEKCGFVVSPLMIYRLLKRAINRKNFPYTMHMIDYCIKHKIRPNKHQVEILESLRLEADDIVLQFEQGKSGPRLEYYKSQLVHIEKFKAKLSLWFENFEIEQEDHPWKQFKVDTSSKRDGFTAYKRHLATMNKLKENSLRRSTGFGNLAYKAEKVLQAQA